MQRLRGYHLTPRLLPANKLAYFFFVRSQHHLQLLDETPHRTEPLTFTPFETVETIRELLQFNGIASIRPATVVQALKNLRHGVSDPASSTQIHGLALSSGLDSYSVVSNSLMNGYAKSGLFGESFKVFETMPNPDIVSWNTILSGYDQGEEALMFAKRMHQTGLVFDNVTVTTSLTYATDIQDVWFMLQSHSLVMKLGFKSDTIVGNALITAYTRCGLLGHANMVFDEIEMKDFISWNALISGLTQERGCGIEAIQIFLRMTREAEALDHVSFSSAIAACGHEKTISTGKQIHGSAIKFGLGTHSLVCNVLISMYSKCGMAGCAKRVFYRMTGRNVVSWTTVISIDMENAALHFKEMLLDGVYPNDVTFVSLIFTVSMENSVFGRLIHAFCYKSGFNRELNISNSLITMYAKLGSMEESRKIFDELNYREVLSWNALISGYAQNSMYEKALKVFSSVILHSRPDQFTFGSVISAISHAETIPLDIGHCIHCHTIKVGLNNEEHVSSALVDMCARRGRIVDSQRIFKEMPNKSSIAWTAMISAEAMHGSYGVVMNLFDDLLTSGICPDPIAFLAVLTACSRTGMVDKGLQSFDLMVRIHGIEPWREHYASVVDMLGRAGRLEEAERWISQMPMGPGASTLHSLLGACRVHRNAEMAQRMADALWDLEPTEAGAYVLMANIYAEKGDWEKVANIWKTMKARGVKKDIGFSWVDMGGEDFMHMHGFTSHDMSHPRAEEIHKMAKCLGFDIKISEED